jgi:histone H3/H4
MTDLTKKDIALGHCVRIQLRHNKSEWDSQIEAIEDRPIRRYVRRYLDAMLERERVQAETIKALIAKGEWKR